MARLPSTVSPQIRNGTLIWCEGDVFDMFLCLSLSALGSDIDDLTGYTVAVRFYDAGGAPVHTFTLQGSTVRVVTLSFTPEVSAKFRRGRYRFDIAVTDPSGKCTSVADDAPAVVR